MERLLLHSCCGPCTLYPLRALREEGYAPEGYFYNPNIHPYREFRSRAAAYRDAARACGLEAEVEEAYGLAMFLAGIRQLGDGAFLPASAERCRVCYRLRMEKTATKCAERGIGAFTTTLLVSPYQDHALIREAGEAAAQAHGVAFLYRDFRPGFRQGQAEAREMGLYMQGYCGCVFSEYARYGEPAP